MLGGVSPTLHGGGQNQKWRTSGPGRCITRAACGVRKASERGTQSQVANKWAGWLHNPFRLRCPQHFRAGDKIRSGVQ